MKRIGIALVCFAAACGTTAGGADHTIYFDLDGQLADTDTYWNLPFPSDLRLDANGAPDVASFPNPRAVSMLSSLLADVPARRGWPLMSIAYFRFTDAIPTYNVTDVIPTTANAPAVLLDIDPSSPEAGTAYPLVAATLPTDAYVATNMVALAPRPGIVLRPKTEYAYILRSAFAPGFGPPEAFQVLSQGNTPAGARGSAAVTAYAPLWPALAKAGIPQDDVLVATVFTTGDETARVRARTEAIRATQHPTIDGLHLVNGDTYSGFCRLDGTITMPQYQTGMQPFDTMGNFALDGSDVPMMQGSMTIPLSITLPKLAMPAGGFPLYQFFHGSGGLSSDIVDLGPALTSADMPTPGLGPGYVVAMHGLAAAGAALPLNPERLPQATDYAYLNINNLSAFPFTFQQGVIEQRLFTDALLALSIDPTLLTGCTGISTPGSDYHFDATKLVAGGQSMGGMYTNMVGSVEGRFGALVPTGAGGFWNLMILETVIIPGAKDLITTALGVDEDTISFVHPTLDAMAMGWEIAEPIVAMSRIAHRPLDGLPPRHVYEPVGANDSYFPEDVYDAAALSYGNQEAGSAVWSTMQDALTLDNTSGLASYTVKANEGGTTRVVVQYMGDGIVDAHYIYRQLDAVKHQYGCFLESYLRDGVPTVPGPGALTDPCP
jgi:hypothetical protein